MANQYAPEKSWRTSAANWGLACYVVLVVSVWLMIRLLSDRWWPATLLLFGPRWIWALPLPVFLLVALFRSWRYRAVVGAVTLLVVLAVVRYNLPWRPLMTVAGGTNTPSMRVLTWNVGLGRLSQEELDQTVDAWDPDVVSLVECPPGLRLANRPGWTEIRRGGLLVASRWPLVLRDEVLRQFPASRWPRPICMKVRVRGPEVEFDYATLHLQSPREGLADIADSTTILNVARRRRLISQSRNRRDENRQVSQALHGGGSPLIVAGDFNTPVDSTIYRASWSRYQNAFTAAGLGVGNTVRIYEGGYGFESRIDHVLLTPRWKTLGCWVGEARGSDHRPVVAEVQLGE